MKRLFALVVLTCFMFSQTASLTLNSAILNSKLNRLSLNDFDFIGQGKTTQLFTGIINITGVSDNTVSFKLEFRLEYNGKVIVNANTTPIQGIDNQPIRFSNTQIGSSIYVRKFGTSSQAELKFDGVTFDKSFLDPKNLNSKLPDGSYKIDVTAVINGTPVATETREFNLRQNWPINLTNPVGEINTPTPLFQWDSRAARYPLVTLYVWENDGNKSSSIAKQPILKQVYDNSDASVIPTSFAFPADNPRPLEDGKKYFWTARVTLATAAGPKEEDNEILEFTYKKPKNDNINATAIKNILRQLIGDAYETIEQEFAGYDLKSMTLNGETATINNLTKYIQLVTSGEYNLLVETY